MGFVLINMRLLYRRLPPDGIDDVCSPAIILHSKSTSSVTDDSDSSNDFSNDLSNLLIMSFGSASLSNACLTPRDLKEST